MWLTGWQGADGRVFLGGQQPGIVGRGGGELLLGAALDDPD